MDLTYFLTIFLLISGTNIKEVVKEFHELNNEETEAVFLSNYGTSKNPSILAYVWAVELKQVEYIKNPFSKLRKFNKSKKELDRLVDYNPMNIHLRYMRLVIQENAPGILGYNDNIEEDKLFLKNKLEVVDDSDYLDLYIHNNTSL